MSWRDDYKKKIFTAQEAVKIIQSGDRVVLGHACGEPPSLVEAMVDRAGELEGVEIVHMVSMGKARYCLPEYEKSFRHNSLFVGGTSRKAVNEGRGDYTPCFFHEIPMLFRDGVLPVDVALITVSPPGQAGVRLPGHLRGLYEAGGPFGEDGHRRRQSRHAAHRGQLLSSCDGHRPLRAHGRGAHRVVPAVHRRRGEGHRRPGGEPHQRRRLPAGSASGPSPMRSSVSLRRRTTWGSTRR